MPSDKAFTAFTAFDTSALASLSGDDWLQAVKESLRLLRSSVHTMSTWKDFSALKTRRELEEVKSTIQTVTDGLQYFYEEPFEQSRLFLKLSGRSQKALRVGDIPTGHKVLLPQFVEALRNAITARSDRVNKTASDMTSKYSRSQHDDLTQMHMRAVFAANAGLLDAETLNRMKGDSKPETSRLTIERNLIRLSIGSKFVHEALKVGGDLLEALKLIEPPHLTESEEGKDEDVSISPVSTLSSFIPNWARTSWDHIIAAGSRTGSPAAPHTASRAKSPEATRRR